MFGDDGNRLPLPESPDADAFWLYLIGVIILLVVLILALCLNRKGYPRRWLAKRLGIEPMD